MALVSVIILGAAIDSNVYVGTRHPSGSQGSEILRATVPASGGIGMKYDCPIDVEVVVRVRLSGYLPFSTVAVISSTHGLTVNVRQQSDAMLNIRSRVLGQNEVVIARGLGAREYCLVEVALGVLLVGSPEESLYESARVGFLPRYTQA